MADPLYKKLKQRLPGMSSQSDMLAPPDIPSDAIEKLPLNPKQEEDVRSLLKNALESESKGINPEYKSVDLPATPDQLERTMGKAAKQGKDIRKMARKNALKFVGKNVLKMVPFLGAGLTFKEALDEGKGVKEAAARAALEEVSPLPLDLMESGYETMKEDYEDYLKNRKKEGRILALENRRY